MAVSNTRFAGLDRWEQRMLASRDGGRMQVAAKRSVSAAPAEQPVNVDTEIDIVVDTDTDIVVDTENVDVQSDVDADTTTEPRS